MLTDKSRKEILRILHEVPNPQSALLPALHLAQRDYGGWLPPTGEAFDQVAAVMGLPPTMVASAASFYTLLQREPVGRHLVQVCTNISCSLMGAEHLMAYISRKLGIQPGETTADGRFTLQEVECLGSCGTAPMMRVDDQYYENLTEGKVNLILEGLP